MKVARRKSKQREKIYEIIQRSQEHPTALMVYDTLKKELPTLSMGNVYRNIKILIEEASIKGKIFADGIEHYDAITELHYHFICKKCHKIRDFEMPLQNQLTQLAQTLTNNEISDHTIQFYGTCESCRH